MTKVALKLIKTLNSKPDQVNEYGNTALIMACFNKMTEVALALIETRNSNPNHVNHNSSTALMFACENKMTEVALKLIVDGNSNPGHVNATNQTTALILACNNKMSEVALALISDGNSKPDQVNENGNTALIWACKNDMLEVALALIKTGKSNPEIISKMGDSALNEAIKNNMNEIHVAITAELNKLNIRISKLQIFDIFSGIEMTVNNFLYNNDFQEKQPFIIEEASGRYAGNYKNTEYENFYECKKDPESDTYFKANKKDDSPVYIKLYGSSGQLLLCEKPTWFNEIGASIKIVKAVKQGLLEQIVWHLSVGRQVIGADHCNLEKPITYYKLIKTELGGIGM
jgi:ankyrin repeat protein